MVSFNTFYFQIAERKQVMCRALMDPTGYPHVAEWSVMGNENCNTPAALSDAPAASCGETPIQRHGIEICRQSRQVFVDNQRIDLAATEYRLLLILVKNTGQAVSRQAILDGLYDGPYAVTDRAVDVQISGLRKKLDTAASYLETVRGVGYRWRDSI
jgi:DNA-binding response OmpR family regulator